MRRGTKLAREIHLTDWSTAGNLSNRSSGVQIPRDICTRFGRYLYSTRCSWIIKQVITRLRRKKSKNAYISRTRLLRMNRGEATIYRQINKINTLLN